MTIAVTGATGHLGRIVIQKLKQKTTSNDIIALARDPGKAKDLGVPVRVADYTQPATLQQAFTGIDTLLLISASEVGQRIPQHANVIAAARKSGVKRVVYTSLLHADTSPLSDLAKEHFVTETAIQDSGIIHVILRNGWYTENYTGAIPGALANNALVGSAGTGRISSASREDYAEAAVVVLTEPGHDGKTYELAGNTAWTLADLAAEISRQTGHNIPYRNLPEAEYATILEQAGLPKVMAAAIASWDVGASQGGLFDDGHMLSRLLGRPSTPLSAIVAEALKQVEYETKNEP